MRRDPHEKVPPRQVLIFFCGTYGVPFIQVRSLMIASKAMKSLS